MDTIFSLGSGDADREQVNLDELYEKNRSRAIRTASMFNRVLKRIHTKIRHVSRTKRDDCHCWYLVPEVILGYPGYNSRDCVAYLINELRENGFDVNYTHPNLLFISWKAWTPAYVREAIRKKTGISINGHGRIRQGKAETVKPSSTTIPSRVKPKKVTFRDIDSYQPRGGLFN